MKFICDRDVIIKAMSISQEIISSKNILSILSNVSIETEENSIKIKATDLKIGFETSVPVDVVIQGSVTIYCDKFLGIIKSLPSGEIEFELKDNMIFTMRPLFKKINFKLKSFNADKFPELPEIGDEEYFEFPQKDLVEMVTNTIFAISDDETRYFMNGVYLEKKGDQFVMVASDGRRLSCAKRTNPEPKEDINGKIIPPKILNILKKLLP
jgi:DNA polymerase-3 subunit beta